MKHLYEYIVNEGLKDSFVNIFKNLFIHGEFSTKKFVTIEVDPKVFGKFTRDEKYFLKENNEYPKLIPAENAFEKDLWHLERCDIVEDKYGNKITNFTYIGHADFRKNNHKIEVDENYKELVEKVIAKYK